MPEVPVARRPRPFIRRAHFRPSGVGWRFADGAESSRLWRRDIQRKENRKMDNVTLIRVIAGVLALVVLGIIIWRRKRQSID